MSETKPETKTEAKSETKPEPVSPVLDVKATLEEKLDMIELKDRLERLEKANKAAEARSIKQLIDENVPEAAREQVLELVKGKPSDEAAAIIKAIAGVARVVAPAGRPNATIPAGTATSTNAPGRYDPGYDHAAYLKTTKFGVK